jgi:hypothetical protein
MYAAAHHASVRACNAFIAIAPRTMHPFPRRHHRHYPKPHTTIATPSTSFPLATSSSSSPPRIMHPFPRRHHRHYPKPHTTIATPSTSSPLATSSSSSPPRIMHPLPRPHHRHYPKPHTTIATPSTSSPLATSSSSSPPRIMHPLPRPHHRLPLACGSRRARHGELERCGFPSSTKKTQRRGRRYRSDRRAQCKRRCGAHQLCPIFGLFAITAITTIASGWTRST